MSINDGHAARLKAIAVKVQEAVATAPPNIPMRLTLFNEQFAAVKLQPTFPIGAALSAWTMQHLLWEGGALYRDISLDRIGLVKNGTVVSTGQFSLANIDAPILVAWGQRGVQHLTAATEAMNRFCPWACDSDGNLNLSEVFRRLPDEQRRTLFRTPAEIARKCDVTPTAVRQWAQQGKLLFVKVNEKYRIYLPSLSVVISNGD